LLAVQSGRSIAADKASSETSQSDSNQRAAAPSANRTAKIAETRLGNPPIKAAGKSDAPPAARTPVPIAINGLHGNLAAALEQDVFSLSSRNSLQPPQETRWSASTTDDGHTCTSNARASVGSTEQNGFGAAAISRPEKRKVQKRFDYSKFQKQVTVAADTAHAAQSQGSPFSLAANLDFPALSSSCPSPTSNLFLPDGNVPLPQRKRRRIAFEEDEALANGIWEPVSHDASEPLVRKSDRY
jgi:hypothetical protein